MLGKQFWFKKKKIRGRKDFRNIPILDIKNIKGELQSFTGIVYTVILLIYLEFGGFIKEKNHEEI